MDDSFLKSMDILFWHVAIWIERACPLVTWGSNTLIQEPGLIRKGKKLIHFKASILVKISISWVPFYLLKYLVIRSTWSDGGNVHTTGSCSEVSNM
jgi:hypothetical protein